MTSFTPTVQVEALPQHHAFKMTWHSPINRAEIALAVQQLTQALEQSDQPVYVVATLRGDSQIPFGLAVSETLRDSCQHPMLAEMLLCGDATATGTISRRLALLTGRCVTRCFPTEADAFRYLAARQPCP